VTNALAGVRVLVTRPAEQASELARMIAAEGGQAILLPALTIEPVTDLGAVRAAIGAIADFDLVVFVSRNAVTHGLALLGAGSGARPQIAAIGPSTAAALERAGRRVSIRPVAGFTSEALLAEPALRQVRGRRVLIVRGRGGRELLADTLSERGAQVVYAEVYERRANAAADTGALRRRWRREGIDLVTALSVETLDALHAQLGADAHELLARSAMVTASARVIKRAATLGLRSVVTARAPDDRALVEAMIAWRRERSPASG
jgi:uroporphyrinogen-III synthase